MALDLAPVGLLTTKLMELLDEEYGEQAEEVELRAAMVLVDVQVPDPEEPEETWTHVRWQFATAGDGWDTKRSSSAYAAGIVAEALVGLTAGQDAPP